MLATELTLTSGARLWMSWAMGTRPPILIVGKNRSIKIIHSHRPRIPAVASTDLSGHLLYGLNETANAHGYVTDTNEPHAVQVASRDGPIWDFAETINDISQEQREEDSRCQVAITKEAQ